MSRLVQEEALIRERRLRLAAERKLDIKQKELTEANRKLSAHALSLSSKIVDQRKVMSALECEKLKAAGDLEKAKDQVVIMERQLWDALETIRDGFALFDADFRLITANRPYLRGLSSANIEPGAHFAEILEHCIEEGIIDLEGRSEDEWFAAMIGRWHADTIEPVTIRLWDGSFVRMVDRRRTDGGIVSMALNITDTMRREVDLREARDNALAADRAKSAFLAKMSHELRTPMNGVVGMADLLLEAGLEKENALYVSTIKNSSMALLDIINDVLDFSKLDAEKITLKSEPFDLEHVLQEVALILEHAVQQKNLQFNVDYDQFLPTSFIGDTGRLRQVLTNLVGNAVKFTQEGHILLRVVGLETDTQDEFQITITVEDTGIGIAEDKLEDIFGEFNQVEDDTNRHYEGTGLGLAITRGLIDQMGGEIWVDSTKGEGSCFGFRVSLPAYGAATHRPAQLPHGIDDALIVAAPQKLDADLLARQLKLLGINVKTASFDALTLSDAPRSELIFLVLDGDDDGAVKLARRLSTTCQVVLVGTSKHAKLVGTDFPFLRKPILRHALFDVISQLDEPKPAAPAPRAEPLRVLAAEDNMTNQLVLKKMLKRAELDLRFVTNGHEAVEAFATFRPDIIFMDISMPGMDGMDATRQIRALEAKTGAAHTPIIAMTAHAMKGDEERIKQSGIDHYMTKPIKKEVLIGHLQSINPLRVAS